MNNRSLFLLGFIIAAFAVGAALYFEHVGGLEPCPLCIFQRVAFIAAGGACLLACLHNPRGFGRRVYALWISLTALGGALIAARHVWLQNLPPGQVPECGPGLEFMLEAFPPGRVLSMVLSGSGECADVQWQMLGLSMPTWSLILLLLMFWIGMVLLFRRQQRKYFSR